MQSIQQRRLVGRPDILDGRFQRAGSQREERRHLDQLETTAFLLVSMLRIGCLIGRRIRQQYGDAVGQIHVSSPPQTRRSDALL